MRLWKTETHMVNGTGLNRSVSASHKSYRLLEIKDIVNAVRKKEMAQGMPQRKLSPVSRYLLDLLIDRFFEEHGSDTTVLEMIIIKDTKTHGI